MLGIIPRLKRLFIEPKVYALILESRSGSILHLGIHYSLDEAIKAASPTLTSISQHKDGENATLDMWTSLSGEDVIQELLNPGSFTDIVPKVLQPSDGPNIPEKKKQVVLTAEDQIRQIKDSKNKLMQSLVENGDVGAVEKAKDLLSKPEKDLIISKITNGKNNKEKAK